MTFPKHDINVTTRRTRSVADTAGRETCTPPEDTILAMLETMNNNLAAQAVSLQKLHETCTATQNSLQFSQSDILDLQKKHELLEKENKSLHERILLLEKKDRDKDRRLNDIAQQIAELDNSLRKHNILIEGVPQTQGENTLNIAMDVLTLICPNITPTNIDVVYRVGNPNVSNRPILLNFTTRSLKEQVMSNKINLRGSQNMKNVWINEDFNQTIRKQKSEARNVVNLARRKGQTIQQKGTGVVLNGIYYPHKEMSRLPDDLQISNTKTKVVNNCTAFCTQHSPLSNMAPCKIEIDGVKYR